MRDFSRLLAGNPRGKFSEMPVFIGGISEGSEVKQQ